MSSVLSVVCVEPAVEPILPAGPLVVQAAGRDPNRACYLPSLTRYFNDPVEGTCYHVFVDIGKTFPSSAPFFPWPPGAPDPVLTLGSPYRTHFDELLRSVVGASRVHRALIICEFNGNVTAGNITQEEEEFAKLHVRIYGPVSPQGFWPLVDSSRIYEGSITIIQEAADRVGTP
jgi:hypothetical protein